MQRQKKFMTGNSDFLSLQAGGFYYVDKTLLIRELLDYPAMVTLITRPRRFGKTLNMSMLQAFFETGSGGKEYFQKLNIWKCGEDCLHEFTADAVHRCPENDRAPADYTD